MGTIELIALGLVSGLFGMVAGSLINIAVFRAKLNGSFGKLVDRDVCLTPTTGSDLVPFASFFAIKDRCLGKPRVIEWQYPAFELFCGVMFAGLFLRAALGVGVPDFVETGEWILLFARDVSVGLFLLIVFVYDLKFSVILDRFSVPAAVLAIVFNIALGADIVNLVIAGLAFSAFFGVQYLLTNGHWVGAGDIRMGLVIGLLLGLEVGAVALLLSYLIASVYGLIVIALRQKSLTDHMPFGTFLVTGIFVAMVAGEEILNWYLGMLGF